MSVELIRMLTTSGVEVLPVEVFSDTASAIGQHWNAVKHFLHTGDISVLQPFQSSRIGPYRFETDPDKIERWAMRGELDFEDIYETGPFR
jgi:hypothetical protein